MNIKKIFFVENSFKLADKEVSVGIFPKLIKYRLI